MKLIIIDKETWRTDYSEAAHQIAFNKNKPASWDRIDFAVLLVDPETDLPAAYITCREMDHETVYWQFGGVLPGTIKTPKSMICFETFIEWAKNVYKRITFLVENDNYPMLNIAMKKHFRIVGIRNFKQTILLEHMLEFNGGA